jgi:hypothetical protein
VESNRNLCLWTLSGVGRAGIAPFLVVIMAPHAFADLSISLIFDSLLNEGITRLWYNDSSKKKSLFNWFPVFPVFNTKKPTRTAQN